ncbi:MAG: YkgJ family cysteine cluster protein [Deferribacteres bacterium]|nr:YkgJ family cysteine cluster protein [candidate division KSB1 bacterium]MCB9500890.1 YkgJ family cysteine cluster protein [Deferribacteres bacterium]
MQKNGKQISKSAGDFSSWLEQIHNSQHTGEGMDVPCGQCTACCESSYFIHIQPEETETLAAIPDELKFAAPGLPKGHVLLGYNQQGRCPMFTGKGCAIYAVRPRTCRQYDCRIFKATGLAESGSNKQKIIQQAQCWHFEYTSKEDKKKLQAVQAAARFIDEHTASFPPGFIPPNPTQQAILAIKVYEVFLQETGDNASGDFKKSAIVTAVINEYNKFK